MSIAVNFLHSCQAFKATAPHEQLPEPHKAGCLLSHPDGNNFLTFDETCRVITMLTRTYPSTLPSKSTPCSLNMPFNIMPSDLFSCNYMTKILYVFLIFAMYTIHTAHHIHIDYTDTRQLKHLYVKTYNKRLKLVCSCIIDIKVHGMLKHKNIHVVFITRILGKKHELCRSSYEIFLILLLLLLLYKQIFSTFCS